jgi:lysophospholipase L1-like esterase
MLSRLPRSKTGLFAASLIVCGLAASGLTVLYLVRAVPADIANVLVFAMVSLFIIVTGLLIRLLGNTPAGQKRLLFAYSTIFLSLVLLEAALHLLVAVTKPRALVARKGTYEYLIDNPIFKKHPDAQYFLKEWSDTKMVFKPFLVWDREEFKGRYFNISRDGVRRTWNPDFKDIDPTTIFTFGGSTMWGSGVSDDQTIASYLSKTLNHKRTAYRVVNYGEVGYSFTQEVIQLLLLLREGHRPDYVIFYDGVNDVYAGYQAGKAELIMNAELISQKFSEEEPTAFEYLGKGFKRLAQDHFLLYKSFRLVIGKFRHPFAESGSNFAPEKIERLALSIRDSYVKTYRLLEIMAETYEFDFICFWQPSGFLEKKLYPEEFNSHPRFKDKTLKALSLKTTETILKHRLPRLFDLTDVLKDRKTLYYFDSIHLSPEGNKTVALKIAERLERELLNSEYAQFDP